MKKKISYIDITSHYRNPPIEAVAKPARPLVMQMQI